MIALEKRKVLGRTETTLFFLLLVCGMVQAWNAWERPPVCYEAVVRSGVGNDLLAGLSRGRQGLVGSLRWAPLPTLLALPLLRAAPPFGGEWAHTFAATFVAAFLCAFLAGWLRRCGVRAPFRLAVAVATFMSPAIRQPVLAGSSDVLFALLVVVAMCCLLHWLETEDLRSLAYLATTLALLSVTRYHAVILLAGALVFAVAHLVLNRHRESYAEATLIIFLVPGVYVAGLWVISNWLLMGDPWFFLRGLWQTGGTWHDWLALLGEGCDWTRIFVLCTVAFLGWGLGRLQQYRRSIWTGAAAVAACALLWFGPYQSLTFSVPAVEEEMAEVAAALGREYADDWVVVSGYRGYAFPELPHKGGEDHMQHTLSFYLDEVLERTLGRRAYLLVPAPQGVDRWEDIHLKYPRVFDYGAEFTVFERSWRHWRLWCIVPMEAELWR